MDHRDLKDLQEKEESLALQDHQVLVEILDQLVHQEVLVQLVHLVVLAHEVMLDRLDSQVRGVNQDLLALQAAEESQVCQVLLVPVAQLDLQGPQDPLVALDLEVKQDHEDQLENQVHQVQLDQLGLLDQQVLQVKLGKEGNLEGKEREVNRVSLDHQDHLDSLDPQDLQDLKVKLDLEERLVHKASQVDRLVFVFCSQQCVPQNYHVS